MQKWQTELKESGAMTEYVKQCSAPEGEKRTKRSGTPAFGGIVRFGPTDKQVTAPRRYTIAAVVDHKNGVLAIATAVAHPVDTAKFSKGIGKNIALGRARKIMAAHLDKARGVGYNSFHGLFDLNTTPASGMQALINESAVGAEKWFSYILKKHAELKAGV